jgi:hypothetical protein
MADAALALMSANAVPAAETMWIVQPSPAARARGVAPAGMLFAQSGVSSHRRSASEGRQHELGEYPCHAGPAHGPTDHLAGGTPSFAAGVSIAGACSSRWPDREDRDLRTPPG